MYAILFCETTKCYPTLLGKMYYLVPPSSSLQVFDVIVSCHPGYSSIQKNVPLSNDPTASNCGLKQCFYLISMLLI